MFKLPSMLKAPQHRRFDLKTRYYDADAEARLERMQKMKAEVASGTTSGEALQTKIREGFKRHRNKKGQVSHRQSNYRIIIIAGLLSAIAYLILK